MPKISATSGENRHSPVYNERVYNEPYEFSNFNNDWNLLWRNRETCFEGYEMWVLVEWKLTHHVFIPACIHGARWHEVYILKYNLCYVWNVLREEFKQITKYIKYLWFSVFSIITKTLVYFIYLWPQESAGAMGYCFVSCSGFLIVLIDSTDRRERIQKNPEPRKYFVI